MDTERLPSLKSSLVFDPRVKDQIFKHNPELFDRDWVDGCHSTLIGYLEESSPPSPTDLTPAPSAIARHFLDDNDGILGHYASTSSSHADSSARDELQRYLGMEPIHLLDNPLLWWKRNEGLFPRIAAGAKAYLAIPGQSLVSMLHLRKFCSYWSIGSSVSVERSFSAGRDIISLRRAALEGSTIRHLMLYRSYLKLEKRLKS